jgi:hypothetical protein
VAENGEILFRPRKVGDRYVTWEAQGSFRRRSSTAKKFFNKRKTGSTARLPQRVFASSNAGAKSKHQTCKWQAAGYVPTAAVTTRHISCGISNGDHCRVPASILRPMDAGGRILMVGWWQRQHRRASASLIQAAFRWPAAKGNVQNHGFDHATFAAFAR